MTGQAYSPWGGPEGSAIRARRPAVLRTLIVGAGRAGRALARELSADQSSGLQPIGFLDDASTPSSRRPLPLPHLGTLADVRRLTTEHAAEAVVLAIPGLPPSRTRELAHAATGAEAVVRYLPWYIAALSRKAIASDLRPLDIRALIDAPEPHVVSPEVKEVITGKRVLVTGAASPLGSEICRQLHAFSPAALFLLDTDEAALHRVRTELWGEQPLDASDAALLTTDIRDRDQTDQAFGGPQTRSRLPRRRARWHAAVLERRPSHGVKKRSCTDNLVRAAARHGTERFVQLSTERPGLDARRLTARRGSRRPRRRAQGSQAGKEAPHEAAFTAVRIGDVLDAHGSLLTTLADQIRAGGPVTVTPPDAARCFATVEEAIALTLEASRIATGGELYTLDLGEPTPITEVVSRFTRQYNLPEVPIRHVGVRHGGKSPSAAERTPTSQPQIFRAAAITDPADYAQLPERLDKLYRAAARLIEGAPDAGATGCSLSSRPRSRHPPPDSPHSYIARPAAANTSSYIHSPCSGTVTRSCESLSPTWPTPVTPSKSWRPRVT